MVFSESFSKNSLVAGPVGAVIGQEHRWSLATIGISMSIPQESDQLLIKIIRINLLDQVLAYGGYTYAELNHELCKFVAANQDNFGTD